MHRLGQDLLFSPSDLNHFIECEHLTTLDLRAVDGGGVAKEKDPQAEIIRAKGFEHERAWLDHLSMGRACHLATAARCPQGGGDYRRDRAVPANP